MKTRQITRFGLLLAMGVMLNYIESMVPLPFMFPGAKLGLANAVGIIVLYYFGATYYFGFGILRVVLTALLWSGFGMAFMISLAGAMMAALITIFLYRIGRFSIFALSVGGSVFHGIGQTIMVSILYQTIYMMNYAAILTISGAVTGILIAIVCVQFIKRVPDFSL